MEWKIAKLSKKVTKCAYTFETYFSDTDEDKKSFKKVRFNNQTHWDLGSFIPVPVKGYVLADVQNCAK